MSLLAAAIEEENWELAALCLLYALAQALAQLHPDAIEGVLDALEGPSAWLRTSPSSFPREGSGQGKSGGRKKA